MLGKSGGHNPWVKYATVGVSVGTVLFGLASGFLRIDARLEAQGEHLRALAESVKSLADKAATVDMVEGKIEHACLRMQLANQGRGWICPFVSSEPKLPKTAPRPAKAVPAPAASLWPFAK